VKLRIVSIGKDRSGLYQPAIDEYAQRIRRYVRLDVVELPEARKHAGSALAREEEGDSIIAKLSDRERVVVLDAAGEVPDTGNFARIVEGWLRGGKDVALVIGGSDGLSPRVRHQAEKALALSRLTFPHRLARLVLLEQLYRAFTILRGEPYHK
jgi:23S rRNA (pseudouridine1915-N3)-methyltransferase